MISDEESFRAKESFLDGCWLKLVNFMGFFSFNKFIYLFVFGCVGSSLLHAFSSCGEWGLLFVAVHGLLIAVASLVAEHGL